MLHEKIDQLLITQEENLLEMQQTQLELVKELVKKVNGHSPIQKYRHFQIISHDQYKTNISNQL